MAKSKKYANKLTSEQFQCVLRNDIKVYAVSVLYSKDWMIEASIVGRINRFDKKLKQDDVQEAIDKTYLYYYDKLMKPKKDKL